MKQQTLRRRLAALIAIRLVVATVLLGSAVVVQLREPDASAIDPFFFLIGLTYAVSLGFIGSLRFVERFPWLTDVHFAIDAMLVSAVVLLTGGVQSFFTILYMLPIVAASAMQFRRGGLQLAGLSTILFVGVVMAQYLHAEGYLALPRDVNIATELPPVNDRAILGGVERVRLFRGRRAERIARRARAARRATARRGHRRDRRPASLQPIRARQPGQRPGHRRRRQPDRDLQPIGDVDYRSRRPAADWQAGRRRAPAARHLRGRDEPGPGARPQHAHRLPIPARRRPDHRGRAERRRLAAP